MQMINTVYTVVEVAKMLKVGSKDVVDAINEGALKCINVGTKQVITADFLGEFLNNAINSQQEYVKPLISEKKDTYIGINAEKIDSHTLLRDYIPFFLNLRTTNAGDRTLEGYFAVAKYFCRNSNDGGLGDYRLNELDDIKIRVFFNKLVRGYSQATVDKIYVVLKLAVRYAYKKGYIDEFIMEDIKKPKSTKSTSKVKAYTDEELQKIMRAAQIYPEIKPIIVLLLHTGMRPGELRALEWKNFNSKDKQLTITNAITIKADEFVIGGKAKKRKAVVGNTKTKASVRTICLSNEAVKALVEWKNYINNNDDFKYVRNSPYIFVTRTKKGFISESALSSKFNRFLRVCGLDNQGYTLYRFRHTFCTKLIKHADLRTVQELMGDSTSDVVMKHYITVRDEDKRKAIESAFN